MCKFSWTLLYSPPPPPPPLFLFVHPSPTPAFSWYVLICSLYFCFVLGFLLVAFFVFLFLRFASGSDCSVTQCNSVFEMYCIFTFKSQCDSVFEMYCIFTFKSQCDSVFEMYCTFIFSLMYNLFESCLFHSTWWCAPLVTALVIKPCSYGSDSLSLPTSTLVELQSSQPLQGTNIIV